MMGERPFNKEKNTLTEETNTTEAKKKPTREEIEDEIIDVHNMVAEKVGTDIKTYVDCLDWQENSNKQLIVKIDKWMKKYMGRFPIEVDEVAFMVTEKRGKWKNSFPETNVRIRTFIGFLLCRFADLPWKLPTRKKGWLFKALNYKRFRDEKGDWYIGLPLPHSQINIKVKYEIDYLPHPVLIEVNFSRVVN